MRVWEVSSEAVNRFRNCRWVWSQKCYPYCFKWERARLYESSHLQGWARVIYLLQDRSFHHCNRSKNRCWGSSTRTWYSYRLFGWLAGQTHAWAKIQQSKLLLNRLWIRIDPFASERAHQGTSKLTANAGTVTSVSAVVVKWNWREPLLNSQDSGPEASCPTEPLFERGPVLPCSPLGQQIH